VFAYRVRDSLVVEGWEHHTMEEARPRCRRARACSPTVRSRRGAVARRSFDSVLAPRQARSSVAY
jgi:hypothetical protein